MKKVSLLARLPLRLPWRNPSSTLGANALARSIAHCRRITRASASSFYHGMKLLPEPERSATYVLYAWLRHADDLGDGAQGRPVKERLLGAYREATHAAIDRTAPLPGAFDHGLWPALRCVVTGYDIPIACLDGLIEGQLLDQRQLSYATCDDLYRYCHHVASLVGVACLRIWGFTGGDETCRLGEQRGLALQLTNILRDVVEDARRGRVYLPAELFERESITAAELLALPHQQIARAIVRLAARAREQFVGSAALDQRVAAAAQPCLWAMTTHYRALLERIAARPERVLGGKRVRLSRAHKAWVFCRALCRRQSSASSWSRADRGSE
ncbi:MAG: phytoene/squalene synthase family protein [Planctomycetota bacterium]